jgi:hypothetical protein
VRSRRYSPGVLAAIVAGFGPAPDRRLGVLVDHLVAGCDFVTAPGSE